MPNPLEEYLALIREHDELVFKNPPTYWCDLRNPLILKMDKVWFRLKPHEKQRVGVYCNELYQAHIK